MSAPHMRGLYAKEIDGHKMSIIANSDGMSIASVPSCQVEKYISTFTEPEPPKHPLDGPLSVYVVGKIPRHDCNMYSSAVTVSNRECDAARFFGKTQEESNQLARLWLAILKAREDGTFIAINPMGEVVNIKLLVADWRTP